MQELWQTSPLDGGNGLYLEEMYETYLHDPSQLATEWRHYFDALSKETGLSSRSDASHRAVKDFFRGYKPKPQMASPSLEHELKQMKVLELIEAFRCRGHQYADFNPLSDKSLQSVPAELDLKHYNLSEKDFQTVFYTGTFSKNKQLPLQAIFEHLNKTYCDSIGSEYMHIADANERRWIEERLESKDGIAPEKRKRIITKLTAAEGLEKYLHSKYVGQKRFSLEGGESLIVMMDELIHGGASLGIRELVIGMAHRGRLNVLVNTLGKPPSTLFDEFEGKAAPLSHHGNGYSGDVKYHMGFSSDIETDSGIVHVALAFNPSHLEIVSPVVMGSVKARQQRYRDSSKELVVPVMIHGDAAFAGQGVVMETLNMSQVRGFHVGGTIHIVVNNQVGFTTHDPRDARSTRYCTDVAKMIDAPVFHVNGDDPEAVWFVTRLAAAYRQKFKKDVVIDLVCYRRHGHNEADEPSATQPLMYQTIKARPSTREIYAEKLVQEGVLESSEPANLLADYRKILEEGLDIVKRARNDIRHPFAQDWKPYLDESWDLESFLSTDTTVNKKELDALMIAITEVPEGHQLNPRVAKMMDDRRKMATGEQDMDWGFAETMSYAAILNDGFAVRLVGQDSGRGTFFHRHAVLHDQYTGEGYVPLQHVKSNQPHFQVIDSFLSEEAVLAYEYGYSTTDPKTLVIWEAQFGDFANGAQVVVDQFISSGEQKWGRFSGLVMLLPHGYEGQGPEHSSARLERYLQLCAQHNIQVCVPTTPAQIFHLLRRQTVGAYRKPLIVMTPKSLLRHKLAVSPLSDLTEGCFHVVMPDIDDPQNHGVGTEVIAEKVKAVILSSGKVYYDLLEKRRTEKLHETAILRIEQLYPFPEKALTSELAKYPNAKTVIWCQEEPQNQGAWYCSQHHIRHSLVNEQELFFAGRASSASPAVGYAAVHLQEQQQLVEDAFELAKG